MQYTGSVAELGVCGRCGHILLGLDMLVIHHACTVLITNVLTYFRINFVSSAGCANSIASQSSVSVCLSVCLSVCVLPTRVAQIINIEVWDVFTWTFLARGNFPWTVDIPQTSFLDHFPCTTIDISTRTVQTETDMFVYCHQLMKLTCNKYQ